MPGLGGGTRLRPDEGVEGGRDARVADGAVGVAGDLGVPPQQEEQAHVRDGAGRVRLVKGVDLPGGAPPLLALAGAVGHACCTGHQSVWSLDMHTCHEVYAGEPQHATFWGACAAPVDGWGSLGSSAGTCFMPSHPKLLACRS